ncbi:uncharacterized protein LOC111812711 [Octodon degus]|uniref:Uncharacterized protein LOC111812711 n=1 Tax=Octodon degus TaxID=10160 RepID=A0A6P6DBE5_OCTDE|nr:uncharacterized protein LOC111812711 [Octodon degus]
MGKSRPKPQFTNSALHSPPRAVQSRAERTAGAPPLPRSAVARQAAAQGLGILRAAARSVRIRRPRLGRRRPQGSSLGVGQKGQERQKPPAGPEGSSAPPGPAARVPVSRRRRRPRCLEPARSPPVGGRTSRPAETQPRLPERLPESGPPRGRPAPTLASPAQGAGPRCGGEHGEGASPGRQRGGGPRAPRPHRRRSSQSHRSAGSRGVSFPGRSGCCPLARRRPPLPWPARPCPTVYGPAKLPAALSFSGTRRPESEPSGPANTGLTSRADPRLQTQICARSASATIWVEAGSGVFGEGGVV